MDLPSYASGLWFSAHQVWGLTVRLCSAQRLWMPLENALSPDHVYGHYPRWQHSELLECDISHSSCSTKSWTQGVPAGITLWRAQEKAQPV